MKLLKQVPKKKKVKRKCRLRISVSKHTHSMKSIQFFFFSFFFEKKVSGNQSIAFKQILETFIPLFGHSNWISYFIRYGLLIQTNPFCTVLIFIMRDYKITIVFHDYQTFDYFISCVQTNSYLVSSVYDHKSITYYNIVHI